MQKRLKGKPKGARYRKQSVQVAVTTTTSRQTSQLRAASNLTSITTSNWHSRTFSLPASHDSRQRNTYAAGYNDSTNFRIQQARQGTQQELKRRYKPTVENEYKEPERMHTSLNYTNNYSLRLQSAPDHEDGTPIDRRSRMQMCTPLSGNLTNIQNQNGESKYVSRNQRLAFHNSKLDNDNSFYRKSKGFVDEGQNYHKASSFGGKNGRNRSVCINPHSKSPFSARPNEERFNTNTGSNFHPHADHPPYSKNVEEGYNPEIVERLRRKIKISKRVNSHKIAQAISLQRQTARKRHVISLMMQFATEDKSHFFKAQGSPITAQQMLKGDCNQLHLLHHRVVLEHQQQQAAIKIQKCLRGYLAKNVYTNILKQIVKIQRWMRGRVTTILKAVIALDRAVKVLQRMMRGYSVREKYTVILHKHLMTQHLKQQEEMFSNFRAHLLESLQVKLAYLFHRRKALRIKREEKEERRRLEDEAEAKLEALRQKKARQKLLEQQRREEQILIELQRKLEEEAAKNDQQSMKNNRRNMRGNPSLKKQTAAQKGTAALQPVSNKSLLKLTADEELARLQKLNSQMSEFCAGVRQTTGSNANGQITSEQMEDSEEDGESEDDGDGNNIASLGSAKTSMQNFMQKMTTKEEQGQPFMRLQKSASQIEIQGEMNEMQNRGLRMHSEQTHVPSSQQLGHGYNVNANMLPQAPASGSEEV